VPRSSPFFFFFFFFLCPVREDAVSAVFSPSRDWFSNFYPSSFSSFFPRTLLLPVLGRIRWILCREKYSLLPPLFSNIERPYQGFFSLFSFFLSQKNWAASLLRPSLSSSKNFLSLFLVYFLSFFPDARRSQGGRRIKTESVNALFSPFFSR